MTNRTFMRASRTLICATVLLGTASAVQGFPVTVTITKVSGTTLDTGARGEPDWYVGVTIDGVLVPDSRRLRLNDTASSEPFWTFTVDVPRTTGVVPVKIEMWEADGCKDEEPFCTSCDAGSGNICGRCVIGDCFPDDHADVNPDAASMDVLLNLDLATGTWSGTTSGECSTGDDPASQATVCWDMTIGCAGSPTYPTCDGGACPAGLSCQLVDRIHCVCAPGSPGLLTVQLGTETADLSACSLEIPVTVFRSYLGEDVVQLDVSPLNDVKASFHPNPLTFAASLQTADSPSATSILTLTTDTSGVPPSDTALVVTATSAAKAARSTAPLTIQGVCDTPMNLVWKRTDDNGLPLNPEWAYEFKPQGRCTNDFSRPCSVDADCPGGACGMSHQRPNPFELCPDAPDPPCTGGKGCGIEAHSNGCITQSTFRQDLIAGACNGNGPGHLNWQVVTYTTHNLRWDGWSNGFDGDYNFRLETEPPGAGMIVNIDGGGETRDLPLEFNYSETVRDFDTEWWRAFRAAVCDSSHLLDKCTVTTVLGSEAWCAGDFTKGPCAMVPGEPRSPFGEHPTGEGIAIGLLGLDLEHEGVAEHHPIYALAINTSYANTPGPEIRDKWALFFRNAGNEGWCSDGHIPLELPNKTLRLTLPWRESYENGVAKDVFVDRQDFHANKDSAGIALFKVPKHGLIVEATLREAESIVHGELDLRWDFGGLRSFDGASVAVATTDATTDEDGFCETKPESDDGICEAPPDCGALISGSAAELVDDERLLGYLIRCLPAERQRQAIEFIGTMPTPPVQQNIALAPVPVRTLEVPPRRPPTPPRAGSPVIDKEWGAWQVRQLHAVCTLGPEWLRRGTHWCKIPVSLTCGDGVVDVGEECDDGNARLNDGCSPTCLIETDFDQDGVLDSVDSCVNIDGAQTFLDTPGGGPKLALSNMGTGRNGNVTLTFSGTVQMPPGWSFAAFDPNQVDPDIFEPAASGTGVRFIITDSSTTQFNALLSGTFSGARTSGWSKNGPIWTFTGSPGTGNGAAPEPLNVMLTDLGDGLVGVRVTWTKAMLTSPITMGSLPLTVTMIMGREGGAATRGECGETHFSTADCQFNTQGSLIACKR